MSWKKSPPALAEAFAAALPLDPRIEPRKMFGHPCAFVNGNLFAGLWQDHVILRLPDTERAEMLAAGGAPFEPMAGRPMREYVLAPLDMTEDVDALRAGLQRALAYALTLPAKAPKARKAKAPPAGATKAAAGKAPPRRRA